MTNTPYELNPENFGLPAELRWTQAPERIGTVVVRHTLSMDPSMCRAVKRLEGYKRFQVGTPGGLENTTWTGLGVTHPRGWATPSEFPIEDGAAGNVVGVNHLSEMTAGNNTIIRQGDLGWLAVGLATYFQVGVNARAVIIEPNPAFDRNVAKQYADAKPGEIEEFRTLPLTEVQKRLLEKVNYDPAKYLTASMPTLPVAREALRFAAIDTDINNMTYDLLLPLR